MSDSTEHWPLAVVSGADRGALACIVRASLRVVEPFYSTAMRTRNAMYDRGLRRTHRLPRPTISVGNLTTGGTGKTPVVRWLAQALSQRGIVPAILMRGYRQTRTGQSDEQQMLADYLGSRGIVIANPNRVAGAEQAMQHVPPPDMFLLDDGFQHRRVARDFNLVLINAAEPFGHQHVLPRGLMREPMSGLRRADALLITRSSAVAPEQLAAIENQLRRYNPGAPIFRSDHVHAGLRGADADATAPPLPMDALRDRRFFVFSGIGDPRSLRRQFDHFGDAFAGAHWFHDHHAYDERDLTMLRRAALQAGAATLVTTEKDWVKIRQLHATRDGMPILRLELRLDFEADAEQRLLQLILARAQLAPDAQTDLATDEAQMNTDEN